MPGAPASLGDPGEPGEQADARPGAACPVEEGHGSSAPLNGEPAGRARRGRGWSRIALGSSLSWDAPQSHTGEAQPHALSIESLDLTGLPLKQTPYSLRAPCLQGQQLLFHLGYPEERLEGPGWGLPSPAHPGSPALSSAAPAGPASGLLSAPAPVAPVHADSPCGS